MNKLAALTAIAAASLGALYLVVAAPFAQAATRPQDILWFTGQGTLVPTTMAVEALAYSATTTTWVNNYRTAVLTSASGTETMVATTTVGLDLTNLGGVSVILKTSSAATAGGTLQAYLLNPETGTWARATDLDLAAVASTDQTWPALWVPVSRGRLYYNPQGIGSVTTTIYLVGQPKS